MTMKTPITDVYCYYTGGNIYVYSAKYGDAYLYGSFDQTIDCYKVRGEILFQDEDLCEQFGWQDEMEEFAETYTEFDDYYIKPTEIEYPTWNDILKSLKSTELLGEGSIDAEENLKYFNPNLKKRTYEEE